MGVSGWDVVGQVPVGGKFVLVGAPHTSNWDFPFTLAAVYIFRLKISWLGKDTLFKKPFGGVMRWLGGIPVDRDSEHGVVDQIAGQFRESDRLVIAIGPEGTRKKRDYWKSGFYQIALAADLPVYLVSVDYPAGIIKISEEPTPITGNHSADMDHIRAYYEGVQGKYPDEFGPPILRSELKKEKS